MSKQLILITAPFNCGHCARAIQELPTICEENGWEFIEMKNESKDPSDKLPVDLYPTVMVRVDEKIKNTLNGYNKNTILQEIKKH
jgi:thiol-disulfide isomerase/thioredoxin